jgi:PKD domain
VTFVSYSEDRDGHITEQAWDLNGDGNFDDATGPLVTRRFSVPGARAVTLRVTDDQGAASTLSLTISVREQPPAGATGASPPPLRQPVVGPTPPPRMLSPFPIVRLVGSVTEVGTEIHVLSVRAPKGAQVLVRCLGRGCLIKHAKKVVGRGPVAFGALSASCPLGWSSRCSSTAAKASGSTLALSSGGIAARNGPTAACGRALPKWRRAQRRDGGQTSAGRDLHGRVRDRLLDGSSQRGGDPGSRLAAGPCGGGSDLRDTAARAFGGAAAARAAPARGRAGARPSASGARRAASARRHRQTTARGADFRASRRSSCARYSGRAASPFAGFGSRAAAPAAASSARSRAGGDDLRRLRVT